MLCLAVKAEQVDNSKRYSFARLTISVHKANLAPPTIRLSSTEGIVAENSPAGTLVMDRHNVSRPLRITVHDPDVVGSLISCTGIMKRNL